MFLTVNIRRVFQAPRTLPTNCAALGTLALFKCAKLAILSLYD